MLHSPFTFFRRIMLLGLPSGAMASAMLICQFANAQEKSRTDVVPPRPSDALTASRSPQVSKVEELWREHPLSGIKASVKPTDGELPAKIPLAELFELEGQSDSIDVARPWFATGCEWDAPSTRHLPLLFEEPNLERLGYTYRYYNHSGDEDDQVYASEYMQPLISGAHFFGRIPLIPYMMWQQPICVPVYTLGVDRPGSPVPYRDYHQLCLMRRPVEDEGVDTDDEEQ